MDHQETRTGQLQTSPETKTDHGAETSVPVNQAFPAVPELAQPIFFLDLASCPEVRFALAALRQASEG
jgi:hypothetical protein